MITALLLLGALDLPARRDPPADVLEAGDRRSRALVVVLSGGSFSERDPRVLAQRALEPLATEAERRGLRLLAPLAPEGSGPVVPWVLPAGEERVLRLLQEEVAARRADARRLYLAGHGAGATGAVVLAARHADLIAGVALWSGTPPPLWDAEQRVVGLAEDVVAGLGGVPVYLWTARDDPLLDRDALRLFVADFRRRETESTGWRLEWVEAEHGGHGHGGSDGVEAGLRFLDGLKRARGPP